MESNKGFFVAHLTYSNPTLICMDFPWISTCFFSRKARIGDLNQQSHERLSKWQEIYKVRRCFFDGKGGWVGISTSPDICSKVIFVVVVVRWTDPDKSYKVTWTEMVWMVWLYSMNRLVAPLVANWGSFRQILRSSCHCCTYHSMELYSIKAVALGENSSGRSQGAGVKDRQRDLEDRSMSRLGGVVLGPASRETTAWHPSRLQVIKKGTTELKMQVAIGAVIIKIPVLCFSFENLVSF